MSDSAPSERCNRTRHSVEPPAAATAETCAKCGCPQHCHRPVKPRRTLADRPDVESYCARCGAEDCWHFTGYAYVATAQPAEGAGTLTREEFDETLRHAENAAGVYVAGRSNVNDHRFTLRLLAHDAALRSKVAALVAALQKTAERSPRRQVRDPRAWARKIAASALAAHGEKKK